jgi:hypothetical protein
MPPGSSRRLSVTKLQRATAAGADLIALCQTVTSDGHLADEEVEALRGWLNENRNAALPAIDFLVATVTKIIADGTVTLEERKELWRAIEVVLPPDVRAAVTGVRKEQERAEREESRARQQAVKEETRAAAQLNRPMRTWNFMVAGVRYEGRPRVIKRFCNPDDNVYLARDKANGFSGNAVEIRLQNGMQIGFVPEDYAVQIAPLLDSGHLHYAWVTKILTGGKSPIPVTQIEMFSPDSTREGLSRQNSVPAKTYLPGDEPKFMPPEPERETARAGCLGVMALVIAGGTIAVLLARPPA